MTKRPALFAGLQRMEALSWRRVWLSPGVLWLFGCGLNTLVLGGEPSFYLFYFLLLLFFFFCELVKLISRHTNRPDSPSHFSRTVLGLLSECRPTDRAFARLEYSDTRNTDSFFEPWHTSQGKTDVQCLLDVVSGSRDIYRDFVAVNDINWLFFLDTRLVFSTPKVFVLIACFINTSDNLKFASNSQKNTWIEQ